MSDCALLMRCYSTCENSQSNMVLDTSALAFYVCLLRYDQDVHRHARTRSWALASRWRAADGANINDGNHRVRACLCRLGIDVSGHSRGDRVVPPAFIGRFPPPTDRPNSLPGIAMEDWSAAHAGPLAGVRYFGVFCSFHREQRCVPGGAHGSFGSYRAAGGDSFAMDGPSGLAATGRHTAGFACRCRVTAGLQRV